MKYFIDTEFHEYLKPIKVCGITIKEVWTIELISIGIKCEDGREYYAISKDFDLKAAWNSWQYKPDIDNGGMKKEYWLRDNVLKPIHYELIEKEVKKIEKAIELHTEYKTPYNPDFCYKSFKHLLGIYGKTNKQIANEIIEFIYGDCEKDNITGLSPLELAQRYGFNDKTKNPEFYGYYSDYDWVVFCWLFGKMIDLPKGFPKFCIDLKQTYDEKDTTLKKQGLTNIMVDKKTGNCEFSNICEDRNNGITVGHQYVRLEDHINHPKQTNEHNALADAIFCRDLFLFLKDI